MLAIERTSISHRLFKGLCSTGTVPFRNCREATDSALGSLNSSVWVANSEGRAISRGVTSCAGMTAQHVLLAQTKIGFLTGGRGHSFQKLSSEDKQSQCEEAFARATVALTRAQQFCFIMCPLDMKGIIGAATVVGCLQHGVGICDERSTGSSLLVELNAALVELYHELEASSAPLGYR